MIFAKAFTITANTAKSSPESLTLKLTACTVKRVFIDFPRGCWWLVGVRALWHTHQIYPTNPDEWLVGDGMLVDFQDNTAIVDMPQEIVLQGYNVDERYDHTVYWYLDVEELSPGGSGEFVPDIYSGYVI